MRFNVTSSAMAALRGANIHSHTHIHAYTHSLTPRATAVWSINKRESIILTR